MKSWWKKALLALAGIAGIAGGAYYLVTRRPLPKTQGKLCLDGLHEPVEIITDRYGVPHIYAQNEDDLYFAQGYVHAQERLWQMEFNRRLCAGRLAELFGPVALETDRFCRRLGLHRAAAEEVSHLSAHSRRVLRAYTRGVNTFIEQNSSRLPVEFTLLRCKPELWSPADTIQWAKMMGWNLGGNWETEVIRAHLIAKLGSERAKQLEAGYDPRHPLIIPPGVAYRGVNLGLLEQYEQIKELSGFGVQGGSNNWVVDGTMTATGAPILCNDPHLGQAAPSIWFECHLVAGDIDVTGASFPGCPGVIIGHNQHIAWGVTNAISDVEDLYIEKFNPQNPRQYEYQGQWEEARIICEEIRVKGKKEPVIEEVRITRHGPILTSMPPLNANNTGNNGSEAQELPLALRWTGLESGRIISSVLKLNLATNWDEFLEALRDWDVPAQNFVYADREGNIGYIMAGAIPIRAKGQAILPMPGWTGEHEWTGYIPFEELPQILNPPQHFIVTANNRVVDDSYPYYITHEWLNGYRAQRIRDLLLSKDKLTMADMAAIQADYYSIPASEIVPHVVKLQGNSALEKAALDMLRTWDYVLASDSVGAAIHITLLQKLERIMLEAVLGDDEALLQRYLGVGSTLLAVFNGYASRSRPLLIRLLNEHDDSWFANSAVPNGPTTWDEALTRALSAAVEDLREKLGDDISRWQYGKIHTITFGHVLGIIKPLSRFFNRGPFAVGGDVDTPNMGSVLPTRPHEVITVPSYRQIINLADMNASLSGHAPGQSGHPASKHYDDFIKMWLAVEHHPMLVKREEIEASAEGTLRLLPRLP
ncbi:MAG: penicillin acylase family protein [Ktedonobacteraceae bacterium]|nr:penicillin acylase family protein [Ktedonobacteraceae bacterium]